MCCHWRDHGLKDEDQRRKRLCYWWQSERLGGAKKLRASGKCSMTMLAAYVARLHGSSSVLEQPSEVLAPNPKAFFLFLFSCLSSSARSALSGSLRCQLFLYQSFGQHKYAGCMCSHDAPKFSRLESSVRVVRVDIQRIWHREHGGLPFQASPRSCQFFLSHISIVRLTDSFIISRSGLGGNRLSVLGQSREFLLEMLTSGSAASRYHQYVMWEACPVMTHVKTIYRETSSSVTH